MALATEQRIAAVEVVLDSGVRVRLGEPATVLLEQVRQAEAESKIAHLEIDEPTVTADRAAQLLGVTRPTVYKWQDLGRLGRVDVGVKRMVPFADIDRITQSRARQVTLEHASRGTGSDAVLTQDDMAAVNELFV